MRRLRAGLARQHRPDVAAVNLPIRRHFAAGQLRERGQHVEHAGDGVGAVPAGILPGHQAMVGSRMPPSHVLPLNPRNGAFTARGVPPLSEVKITSVFRSSFEFAQRVEHLPDAPVHFLDPVAVDAVGRFARELLAGINREMHGGVRQVEEERLLLVAP